MKQGLNIYLLRHGDAAEMAPDGTMHDAARELSTPGKADLASACASYARLMDPPQQILHSPLIRAHQSAEILALACDFREPLREVPELRPGGNPVKVVDLLQEEFLGGCSSIVLVGHEPLLGDLLGLLISGTERLSVPLRKGMLSSVQVPEPRVMVGRLQVVLTQEAGQSLS